MKRAERMASLRGEFLGGKPSKSHALRVSFARSDLFPCSGPIPREEISP